MRRIAKPAELGVILTREVRPQALAPGAAIDRLEQVSLVRRSQGRRALDDGGAGGNVSEPGPLHPSQEVSDSAQLPFRQAIAGLVVPVYRLVRQALQAPVPGEVLI